MSTLPAFSVQLILGAAAASDWLLLLADHIKQSSSCILAGSLVSLQLPEQTAQQQPVKFWFVSHFLSQRTVSETSASSDTESDINATGRGSHDLSNSGMDRLSSQGSANAEAAQAAATALQNLLLDKDAQSLVVDLQGIAIVAKLLSTQNWLLAARAAGDVAYVQLQKDHVADVKYADILPLMCVYCMVPCTRSLCLHLVLCMHMRPVPYMSKTMFAHPAVTHYFSSK